MLQDIGFKPRNLSESDIVTAIRSGNGNYGVGTLASRRRGDETYQNRSGIVSGGYKGEISGEGEIGRELSIPAFCIVGIIESNLPIYFTPSLPVQTDLQSDYVRLPFSILRILGFKGY